MRLIVIGFLAAFFLSGCATSPEMPKIATNRGDRVGLLVDVGDNLSHMHVGTTVFSNFSKRYDYNFNLQSDVTRTIEKSLRDAGLVAVDLRSAGLSHADLSGLIQITDEKWQIAAGKESVAQRLRNELGLKAVLVLKEARVLAALECFGGPCTERYMDASGMFTRSFMGATGYSAIAAYRWNVFVLDPVADTARTDTFRKITGIPAIRLRDFNTPADLNNLTERELAPIRDAILKLTEDATVEAVKTLNVK